MSNTDYDDFDDDGDERTGPKALREELAKVKKQLKAATDALESEKTARVEAEKKAKSASLADLLRGKSIDPKFAKLAERDGVDPSPEAIDKWIEDNKELYAFGEPKTSPESKDTPPDDEMDEDSISPELREAVEQGRALEGQGFNARGGELVKKIQSLPDDPHDISWDKLVEGIKG